MNIRIPIDFKAYSPFEKAVTLLMLFVIFVSGYISIYKYSLNHSSVLATNGGTIREGVLGTARFVNPILATSEVDKDLSALVYSGLSKPDTRAGITTDLAKSIQISQDAKEYTFTIRDDAFFSDGHPVTAQDVVFTIERIQNPETESPYAINWDGVQVVAVDDKTVKFTLRNPYSSFIENTTIGILPKHIWEQVRPADMQFSAYNESPVGSGPYILKNITKDGTGVPKKYYLEANNSYYNGAPYIPEIEIYSFSNNKDRLEAWQQNKINSVSAISPLQLETYQKKGTKIIDFPYPREFIVFFNQSKNPSLANKKIRQALSLAIDKDKLIQKILKGHAEKIDSPVLNIFKSDSDNDVNSQDNNGDTGTTQEQIDKIMSEIGWKKNTDGYWEKKGKVLSLSLSLSNADELEKVANFLQDEWRKAGFKVLFKKYELGSLMKKIIRKRDYEMLLFGELPGRSMDLYPFWHSSQRDDPGLNIARYKNKELDTLLEKLSKTYENKKQLELLQQIDKVIKKDTPAIFLYSPYFIYITSNNLDGVTPRLINYPYERFTDVNKWSLKKNRLWNFFRKNK